MNIVKRIFAISIFTLLFSSYAMAATENQIAIVNVTQLFNTSSYVQQANKTLQNNLKEMEKKVQDQQNKIKSLVSSYEQAKTKSAKDSFAAKIKIEQTTLTTMTQDSQKKVQEEQNAGMQKFSQLVQAAVSKVAKEKHINTVLNSASVIYTDNSSWVDITKEVESAMSN